MQLFMQLSRGVVCFDLLEPSNRSFSLANRRVLTNQKVSFDLDEGFGNFLNCTEEKESFETESTLEPGNFRTNA